MFISGAYQALRSRKLDMSVLIAVGVLAAYLASAYLTVIGSSDLFYEAAAMLVTFVLFGHWMEMKSRRGTSDALQALFKLVPPKARVIRGGAESEVPTAEVVQGDILALRPGDRIPVDGEITEGETAVDEALVTGESLPVEKKPGDALIAGSINGAGSVKFKATGVGEETTLARIAKLVETAQNSKAPGQRLADKAAAYLVVLAVGVGIITFVAWRFGGGASFLTALTFAISAHGDRLPGRAGAGDPDSGGGGNGLGGQTQHSHQRRGDAGRRGADLCRRLGQDRHAHRGQAAHDGHRSRRREPRKKRRCACWRPSSVVPAILWRSRFWRKQRDEISRCWHRWKGLRMSPATASRPL